MSLHIINIITILIISIFLMPLLIGLLYPISNNRIHNSLLSALDSFKFIISIIFAFRFVTIIFSDKNKTFLLPIYKFIPSIENIIHHYRNDIAAYLILLFVLFFINLCITEILAIPLYKYIITPLTNKITTIFNTMNNTSKRILNLIWQIPKSLCMVLIFSLLLNFYTNFINNPTASEYINQSTAYQIINKNILLPILNSNIVKNLPVLINDSFKKAAEDFTPANNNVENPNYWKTPVIKYFNGVTLDEAVMSTSEIDDMAKKIVGNEENDKLKAYLIYKWISQNIDYDKNKAEIIVKNPSHVNSGSIVTFSEREGVCFDYSCLYVSMCRAVGLKVRFITGLAYNGSAWGDHAWNQIYYSDEQRWINIDTTFGNSGANYFDNLDFSTNHKYDVIQAEW